MSKSTPGIRPEIRVLGLDTCNPNIIIGAILRGGQYLDGVLTFSAGMKTTQLASRINATKYRPELRAIMIHDPSMVLDSSILEQITNLPVLELTASKNGRLPRGGILGQRITQKTSKATLGQQTVDNILDVTRTKGRLAEPVRIAHLLAKLRVFGRFLQEKR